MTEQLKPCPFCGGEADIMTPEADNMKCATVMCMGCHVTGKEGESIAEAVEAWNARAAMQPTPQEAAKVLLEWVDGHDPTELDDRLTQVFRSALCAIASEDGK